jgi:hypothetical protein
VEISNAVERSVNDPRRAERLTETEEWMVECMLHFLFSTKKILGSLGSLGSFQENLGLRLYFFLDEVISTFLPWLREFALWNDPKDPKSLVEYETQKEQ